MSVDVSSGALASAIPRKLVTSILTMAVAGLGVWSIFVQRPVYHAKPGFVRLVCPGTADAQIPYQDGMTLRDALKVNPAIAQFGVDQVETIWMITKPTHSAWSDFSEAMQDFLIKQAPEVWHKISAVAPNFAGPSSPQAVSLSDSLHSGEAVHLQSRW
jgi:hypothetical protein